MGKIGLIDVDGRNFPNLALMKISAYHKSLNDSVEWVTVDNYDRTYMSKIFSFSADPEHGLSNYGEIIKGGTGYNMSILPDYIDKLCPDYSIYPRFKEAYGFLTRGCPNKCEWCIVPTKEGNIKPYADIEEFLNGRKAAILMDNNVLASEHGLKQLEKIAKMRLPVDFNQGLDARIIAKNESIAELLGSVKWYKPLRMACDTLNQLQYVEKATELLRKHQANPKRYFVYVLVKNVQDALERVEYLNKIGLDPFAQPYRDFNLNTVDPEAKKFARWVNRKQIFRTVSYADYH